ncbi:MAG: hypothetical protein IT385_18625 [Deltaproteobacteria bacterium]|nr:hypothetical protein [Deltaproteobacteria bacterium]
MTNAVSPWLILLPLALGACESRAIPAHVTPEAVRAEAARFDPGRYLTGGELVFKDDFERAELGPRWVVERSPKEADAADWRIEGGWLMTQNTKNQGVWAEVIPDGPVRVELVARSLTPPDKRQRFVGDLKLEAFATGPEHEKGYSLINGGWSNQFDTIAKLGEHSADERRVAARPLEADKVYRYAAVRTKDKILFFRDGELLYTFDDARPIQGRWLGLNNWQSHAAFGEVAVYKLPAE